MRKSTLFFFDSSLLKTQPENSMRYIPIRTIGYSMTCKVAAEPGKSF